MGEGSIDVYSLFVLGRDMIILIIFILLFLDSWMDDKIDEKIKEDSYLIEHQTVDWSKINQPKTEVRNTIILKMPPSKKRFIVTKDNKIICKYRGR